MPEDILLKNCSGSNVSHRNYGMNKPHQGSVHSVHPGSLRRRHISSVSPAHRSCEMILSHTPENVAERGPQKTVWEEVVEREDSTCHQNRWWSSSLKSILNRTWARATSTLSVFQYIEIQIIWALPFVNYWWHITWAYLRSKERAHLDQKYTERRAE